MEPIASRMVSLIVAEAGADWISWSEAGRAVQGEVVVLLQRPEEKPEEFAGRVTQSIDEMARQEIVVDTAAVLPGSRWNQKLSGVRPRLARSILAYMLRARRGVILLDDRRGNARSRRSMAAMGRQLAEQVRGTGVSVVLEATPAQLRAAA